MSGGGKRKRGGHEEEHENHERWLLTYADMITLLMVLFIVMFAMSTVDAKKFDQLKESLAGAFGGSQSLVVGGASGSPDTAGVSPDKIDLQSAAGGEGADVTTMSKSDAEKAVQQSDRAKAAADLEKAREEVAKLREVQKKMTELLAKAGLTDSVQFTIDQRGLVVTIVTSSVVFAGDSAELLLQGKEVLDAVAPALTSLPNHLEIGGHTNQLPVPTRNYPSSWELSTARASSVVRYLLAHGVPSSRMTAAGYADTKPLYDPSDPLSVTRNRRVEVVVMSDQSAEVKALLPTAAGEK
ncbi:flagellar motor protein MotB [Actinokineospora cianjurensis]|uniref:Chemotaxis protein MotB n=1 Tax=Actinokineospora cianjurensis TaxID=585224 RepID=A0A421AUJ1_9PSEU|nr:flagellar motor protein MotB [Actinokineospora cianjurensis]RLK53648.1 chemotaxis protein MotB [Actinokineospora cianjurensis]